MSLLLLGIAIGIVATVLLLAVLLRLRAASLMLPEKRSPHTLDDTVRRLTEAALARGWVVQSVIELEKPIEKNGGGKVRPVRLVNICQAKHAARIMNVDSARRVSVLMPCTISVYEKSDGSVWLGAMNPGLLALLFGGVVGEVMGGAVAAEQAGLIQAAT